MNDQPVVRIKVVSEEGVATKIYKLRIVPKSNDNTIDPNGYVKLVRINDMDRPVGYNTAKGAYVVSVAEGTSKLPIRIKANSPFAKVAVDRFANPLGSDGASYSDNNEIMLPGYDISGTDLNKGLEIPFYVKAENGVIRTYKIIVQTAARDTAVTKVELIIDGVAREAVVNKLNPLEYNIVVGRDVSKADIRVTPNSYEVHEILIGGAYDSIDNITGARTRNNYPMELGNEFTVPISVTASDKLTKEDGYKLIIKKVDLNMDLASVKVDETSLTKGAKDTYTYIANTNVLNSKANILFLLKSIIFKHIVCFIKLFT